MGQNESASAVDETGTSYLVQFSSQPFAEGTCQYAYRGKLLSPGNMDVVVKKFKDEFANYRQDWRFSVNTSKKAEELARKFNVTTGTNRPIHFNIPFPMKRNDSPLSLFYQEWVVVEPYIPGVFKKWLSNAGWVNTEEITTSLPAFTHWTWVETGGQLIVCDLQGVKDVNGVPGYTLTDPAINSLTSSYGITDLGPGGIGQFFTTHTCNDICRNLGIAAMCPDRTGFTFNATLAASRGTTYRPMAATVRRLPPPGIQ